MGSKWTKQTGRGTFYSTETWEGDRRHTSIQLEDTGAQAVSPDIVLWADADHGVVVGQEVLLPDAPLQAIVESLRKAMAQPLPRSGLPRQPRRIRIRRPELADAVRPVAEALGIDLEVVEALPLVDDLFRELESRFGTPSNQGYLHTTDIQEPLLAELFAVAADFYRARPWKVFPSSAPLLLECDQWSPRRRYVVILGAQREVKGLALYESLKDLRLWSTLSPEAAEAGDDAWRIPALSLMFERLSTFGPQRVEEAKERGWSLASRNAYPLILGTGRGRESHWPTPGEARLLIAAMRTLMPFLKRIAHSRGREESQLLLSEAHRVGIADEDVLVHATYPAYLS